MEITPLEGHLPGIFVPTPIMRELDNAVAILFTTLQAARQYLADTNDGSLECQMLRRALHDSFFPLHDLLDSAELLRDTSRFTSETRPPDYSGKLERPDDTEIQELVRVGRTLLVKHMIIRELQNQADQRLVSFLEQQPLVAERSYPIAPGVPLPGQPTGVAREDAPNE
ncbi:MAG TPA: hypothetical protein VHI13_11815 [Candidatus Kapabacteria bacterium]|nr:hypothetical protein [Candidatus Kapabacteria bacterium]